MGLLAEPLIIGYILRRLRPEWDAWDFQLSKLQFCKLLI